MKKPVLLGIVFVVVVLGVIVYSTMNLAKYRVKCAWRLTAGTVPDAPGDYRGTCTSQRGLNACATIASGMTTVSPANTVIPRACAGEKVVARLSGLTMGNLAC